MKYPLRTYQTFTIIKRLIRFFFIIVALGDSFASMRDIIESGYTPTNIAVGGSSTNILFPSESSVANPALMGDLARRSGAGIGYANIELIDILWAQIFIPSPVGTVTLNGGFLDNKMTPASPNQLQRYYFLSVGYARQFTSRFSFGVYFKPAFATIQNTVSFFSLSLEPSFMYNTKINLATSSGLGLYDLTVYFLSHNLGVNIGDSKNIGPRISLHLGTQFLFYHKYDFKVAINAEIIGVGDYDSLPTRLGLDISYRFLNIAGGYAIGTTNDLFNGFTIGGGVHLNIQRAVFSLNYAFAQTRGGLDSGLHTIFLQFNINYADKIAPQIHIKQSAGNFSPNWDGKNDYVNFTIEVQDTSLVKEWSFSILDKRKRVVRKFASDTRNFEKKFSFKDFFIYFFKKQKYLSAPSQIRWDGTGDPVALEKINASSSGRLPDGIYFYNFVATDEWGNKSKPFKGVLKIDRVPPDIKVGAVSSVFSPNGDGVSEEVTILQERNPASDDEWKASFVNSEGEMVKTYQWHGHQIPVNVIWNGKNDKGEPVLEGLYTYIIEGNDPAGNHSKAKTQLISLIRKVDVVDVQLSFSGLSPNGDHMLDTLKITPITPNKKNIKNWKLTISEKPYHKDTKKTNNSIIEWIGEKIVTKKIEWDGKTKQGEKLQDGTYYAQLFVEYKSGNYPSSLPKKIILDTQKPEVDIDASLSIFSPDGDGEEEEQFFALSIQDDSPIKRYQLDIDEVSLNNHGTENTILFKKFEGNERYPKEIYWDGKSDKGSLVESATEYHYYLTATDIYGNQMKSEVGKFETDILVLITERGLKIRISNIEFDLGKATLKPKTKDLIKKIYQLLERYASYDVKVEGHTDDLGDENFNLILSENRAKAVVDHLIELGTNSNRLDYQGVGEVSPLVPNKNWYNRSRNRRVEFLLKKN